MKVTVWKDQATLKHGILQLPPFEDFQEKFQQAFGRELTRDERRFYRLINIVLEEDFLGQVPASQAHQTASDSSFCSPSTGSS
jgi:hypothetical protein